MQRKSDLEQALASAKQRHQDFRQHRRAFNPAGRAWYRIESAQDAGDATLYIYDAIGIFGIEAERLVKDLDTLDAERITLRINSPGGDVFDGMAIYNALVRHPATIDAKIDSLAASMASIIALAGDTVEMQPGSFYMIHKPWSIALGNADDFRKEAELLDKIEGQAIQIYANKSGMSEEDVRAATAAETWYTAQEAVDAGFADSVADGAGDGASANAKISFDLSVFQHTPRGLRGDVEDREPSKRELEMSLRDAGYSAEVARAVAAHGHAGLSDSPGQGDADHDELELAHRLAAAIPV